jgi:hypothetical protein
MFTAVVSQIPAERHSGFKDGKPPGHRRRDHAGPDQGAVVELDMGSSDIRA